MFKIFSFFINSLAYCRFVNSQPLSFGFSYGKNFTHATTLMRAAFSKLLRLFPTFIPTR